MGSLVNLYTALHVRCAWLLHLGDEPRTYLDCEIYNDVTNLKIEWLSGNFNAFRDVDYEEEVFWGV